MVSPLFLRNLYIAAVVIDAFKRLTIHHTYLIQSGGLDHGLRSVNRNVGGYSTHKQKQTFLWAKGSEYPETIRKLSSGTIKMAAYANKFLYACL